MNSLDPFNKVSMYWVVSPWSNKWFQFTLISWSLLSCQLYVLGHFFSFFFFFFFFFWGGGGGGGGVLVSLDHAEGGSYTLQSEHIQPNFNSSNIFRTMNRFF